MTATKRDSLTCSVCHKPMAASEQYLVRRREGRTTTVHRHLCFPPRVEQPQQRAA